MDNLPLDYLSSAQQVKSKLGHTYLTLFQKMIKETRFVQSGQRFLKDDCVIQVVFDDGDIYHAQNLTTGTGTYTTCDSVGAYDATWGNHDDACVLFSFHDQDESSNYRNYFVIHFFDSQKEAIETSKAYAGHHFILMAKLNDIDSSSNVDIIVDYCGLGKGLSSLTWREITILIFSYQHLDIVIGNSMKKNNPMYDEDF